MLYTKARLKDGRIVRSGIQENNTYAVCSECGKEIPVHLGEIFSADNTDPLDADIVCPECTRKHFRKQKPTMEDLVLLATVLCRLGYTKQILSLYGDFGITAIQELRVQDYGIYAKALLSVVAEGGAV
jgi:DNA-directed RNA polymerase subunit RPC12/RpoP